jgi:endo-1,4-beta-D-glucanase Y
MKKNLTILLVCIMTKGFAQNKPFPQMLNYPGCIKPSNYTQTQLNLDVSTYYDYWKSQYLKTGLTSLPGGYYVKGDITGSADGYTPLGSSEGQGYGMLITVLMAGYDPQAKIYFDGLYKTMKAFKSSVNANLMGWVVADATSAQGHFDSATDGDMDMAYSLVLAHYQWGSNGTINYLAEAKRMITNGLKSSNATSNNRLNLGDWDSKNSYDTRPSDWMMSHMRAFYNETNDATWLNVINNLYSIYTSFSNTYSPSTGLVTDFIVGNPAAPCPTNFLDEYPETNTYSYNACRFPLRIVLDYALYGSAEAFTVSNKLVSWVRIKTSQNPANIKDGYKLDGTTTGTGKEAVFIAPFVAASIANGSNQTYLNSGWTTIRNLKSGYFSDSYNMLCMLLISGNWWIPGGVTTAISTTDVGQPSIIIYPNPANESSTIKLNASKSENAELIIYNTLGTTVYNNIIRSNEDYNIDLKDLASGIYLVNVNINGINLYSKIIKQ